MFVPIESKGWGNDLEDNIGNRLKDYIKDLFRSEPTAYKANAQSDWRFFNGSIGNVKYQMIAVGALLYKSEYELGIHLRRGNLDAVFAFEFGNVSKLHFYANENGRILLDYLEKIASEQGGFVVKVHGL